jgi:hypothetical protein
MLRWAGDDAGFANNHTTLLLSLRRDQGRLEKFRPLLLAATAQAPGLRHMVRLALAFVHIELGELDEARARLAESVAADIGPRGLGWSVMLAARAEVCAGLGDTRAVDELTTALSPYTGQLIVVGTGSGCLGAADRYRGMVAATGGQLADAERLFETALALEESIGSAPLASRTRVAHARALLRSGQAHLVRQAMQLLDAAANTAQRLGMAGLMHEIDSLRGTGPHSD